MKWIMLGRTVVEQLEKSSHGAAAYDGGSGR